MAEGRGKSAESLIETCRALQAGRGEASGVALAAEILRRYRTLDPMDHAAFFHALADEFGPDRERVREAISNFGSDSDEAAASEIHFASEPRRHELIRRLNRAPGGTAALVEMRADLLALMNQNPSLVVVDRDFLHLFGSWFNRGFLVLRPIDWSSPATVLEKIIRYEAVHEIGDWDDSRPHRSCRPSVLRVLSSPIGRPAADLRRSRADLSSADGDRAALGGGRGNCRRRRRRSRRSIHLQLPARTRRGQFRQFHHQAGGRGDSRELPAIETFVTLSPVPGFRVWLEAVDDPAIASLKSAALELATQENWPSRPASPHACAPFWSRWRPITS